jgi:hypothetical protein
MAIDNILRPFSIFCGILVYFVIDISRFAVLYQEKNLATLIKTGQATTLEYCKKFYRQKSAIFQRVAKPARAAFQIFFRLI